MKKIIIVLCWLLLNGSFAHALEILSPKDGDTFMIGDTIKLIAELSLNSEADRNILFVDFDVLGAGNTKSCGEIKTHPYYECDFTIPLNSPEKLTINAYGMTANDLISSPTVTINVKMPSSITLESIRASSDSLTFGKIGRVQQISVTGKYSDGVERDIQTPTSKTTYTSNDTSIATVDSDGLVKAVSPGDTTITVSNSGKSIIIPIRVYLHLDPPKNFTVVSVPTGLQLTWQEPIYDPAWAIEYVVRRSDNKNGVREKTLITLPKGTTSYIDTTTEVGKPYYYRMRAGIEQTDFRSTMTSRVSGTKQ